jgi:DNA-binding XRE family transcriptional regulator
VYSVKSFHLPTGILHESFSRENFSRNMINDDNDNWLVAMRKDLNLTQEHVAKALGVTTRTVINWENGHHEPKLTIKQTKALCKLLNVTLDDLPDNFPNGDRPGGDNEIN